MDTRYCLPYGAPVVFLGVYSTWSQEHTTVQEHGESCAPVTAKTIRKRVSRTVTPLPRRQGRYCTLPGIRVQRLHNAGRIPAAAGAVDVVWMDFVLPVCRVLWAGLYALIRSAVYDSRHLAPFLLACITSKAQPIRLVLRVREGGLQLEIGIRVGSTAPTTRTPSTRRLRRRHGGPGRARR